MVGRGVSILQTLFWNNLGEGLEMPWVSESIGNSNNSPAWKSWKLESLTCHSRTKKPNPHRQKRLCNWNRFRWIDKSCWSNLSCKWLTFFLTCHPKPRWKQVRRKSGSTVHRGPVYTPCHAQYCVFEIQHWYSGFNTTLWEKTYPGQHLPSGNQRIPPFKGTIESVIFRLSPGRDNMDISSHRPAPEHASKWLLDRPRVFFRPLFFGQGYVYSQN